MKFVPALAATALLLSSCALAPTTPPSASAGVVQCTYRPSEQAAKPVDPPSGADVPATGTVRVTLNLGDATLALDLDRAAAPCAVASFLSLASQGFYDGTSCHRLSTTGIFILQCGDPTQSGRGGPGYRFDDELRATTGYPAGAVAMANAGPNTNGSQFFLVYADTPLPKRYTVLGRLDAAATQVVADRAHQGHDGSWGDGTGRPNAPTTIQSVVAG